MCFRSWCCFLNMFAGLSLYPPGDIWRKPWKGYTYPRIYVILGCHSRNSPNFCTQNHNNWGVTVLYPESDMTSILYIIPPFFFSCDANISGDGNVSTAAGDWLLAVGIWCACFWANIFFSWFCRRIEAKYCYFLMISKCVLCVWECMWEVIYYGRESGIV